MTDWGEAARIFGIGFGGVFAILIILAIVLRLSGSAIQKRASKKEPESTDKK